jgi:diacylglycerol kinase (ATP)
VALRAFEDAGIQCDEFPTEAPGHALREARQASATYDAVFTLGGDGTVMEVLTALAHSGKPVGILPAGTGNLLARSLGVPLDVKSAVRDLTKAGTAKLDLGRLPDGRCFAFGAGIGLDVTMIEHTPYELKRRLGVLAYVLAAAKAVLSLDRFRIRLTVDGEVIDCEAAAALVLNFGTVLNERLVFGDGIKHDDGYLNLCVFSPKNWLDAIIIFWRLLRKNFKSDPRMLYRPGRSFLLETMPPRATQADGELLGPTPLRVTVEAGAGTVLFPKGA